MKKPLIIKKYKDEEFLEYTIKIRRVRGVTGYKWGKKYTDKMYLVDVKERSGGITSFGMPIRKDTGTALKKVFKEIKELLYL